MELRRLKMDEIDNNPELNCRGILSPIDVIDLAKDIKEKGLIQPVVVSPYDDAQQSITGKKYRLIAGFRRYMAHIVNAATKIDTVVRTMSSELEALTFNLSENIQRADLNILQEARAIKRLQDFGLTEAEAGQQLGMSRGWIQIRFMLLKFPEDIQQEAAAGIINQQNIRDLYTIYHNSDSLEELYTAVKSLKDQKLRGQVGRVKAHSNRTKPKNQKKQRKRLEIFEMMGVVQKSIGNGLHTRALAWAAGEITDLDFYTSLKQAANDEGLDFQIPMLEV